MTDEMTGEAPEIGEAELDEETVLSEEQLARSEALFHAKELLTGTHEVHASMFTAAAERKLALTKPGKYTADLLLLATFILDGGELLDDEHGCSGRRCACEIAAEFTGGETDVATLGLEPVLLATEDDLYRHAQKQDVGLRDAYSYFRDILGYDMRNVRSMEFDSTNPNEQEQEGNL